MRSLDGKAQICEHSGTAGVGVGTDNTTSESVDQRDS